MGLHVLIGVVQLFLALLVGMVLITGETLSARVGALIFIVVLTLGAAGLFGWL